MLAMYCLISIYIIVISIICHFICKAFSAKQDSCVCTQWLQSCPTVCDSMNCGPQGSSVSGILYEECCSGLPCPPPGDLSDPGVKSKSPASPALQANSLLTCHARQLLPIKLFSLKSSILFFFIYKYFLLKYN